MIDYDRIYVSEGIDINRTGDTHKCIMCQLSVITAIITVKGHDYKINFWFVIKKEVMDRMKNADLIETIRRTMIMKKKIIYHSDVE